MSKVSPRRRGFSFIWFCFRVHRLEGVFVSCNLYPSSLSFTFYLS
jgi:hypothetical protein